METCVVQTPLGLAEINGDETGIFSVSIVNKQKKSTSIIPNQLKSCVKQLDEYFDGKRLTFDLKLKPQGTSFQKNVWSQLQKIPYGKTISYADLASDIDNPGAQRAVGRANGDNRFAIVIPCHRVIRSDGTLSGYGGGIWRKQWLLDHEREVAKTARKSPK